MQRDAPDHLQTIAIGGAYLFVSLLVLIASPPNNWEEGGSPQLAHFISSWTAAPTWNDGDPWVTNFIGHPIMGALLFSLARHNGHSATRSLLFAAVASTMWEYALESWFEQPSWTDLLVTPTAGALLGEARWRLRRRLLDQGDTRTRRSRVLLALIAPVRSIRRAIQLRKEGPARSRDGGARLASYAAARRVAVAAIGGTLLAVGALLLVLPGPGLLVIGLGIAVLGVEFAWARRWLKKLRARIGTITSDR